jgi:hypothetical protein
MARLKPCPTEKPNLLNHLQGGGYLIRYFAFALDIIEPIAAEYRQLRANHIPACEMNSREVYDA